MTIHQLALLAGLFGAPAWLAWYGHHLRDRSPRGKAAFWGTVIGHSLATLVLTWILLAPPVMWQGLRETGVYWVLLAGAAIGGMIGWAVRGSR